MLNSIWSKGTWPGPSTMTCTPLAQARSVSSPRVASSRSWASSDGVGQAAGAEAVAEAEADVVFAHDVADVVEDFVHRILLVVVDHPLGQQASAAADDADQALADKGEMLAEDAGVDGEIIDALLGLVFQFLEDDVVGEVFDLPADDHRIDRDGADGDGAVLDDRLAAGVEIAAGGEIHDRVGAPALGPLEFFDFFIGAAGDGGGAHVGVDLGEAGAADAHGFELVFQMDFVGGNDHAAGGDFGADLLGGEMRLAQWRRASSRG